MTNRNERMEKLTNAGIEVGKYFTLEVPEGLDAGTKIHIVFDESGVPKFANGNENDAILNQIIEDGYVRNTKLHRRFVMAQMFHHLNYVSCDKKESGYNACIKNCYGYKYTIDMMIEEVRVLSKLEVKDKESFEERVHFFDKNTVAAVLEDYLVKLKNYVDGLPKKNCKGVPYKRVKNKNIFEADLEKKLYIPIKTYVRQVKFARDYKTVYNVLCRFRRNMVKLPGGTPKSKAWLDAYKGEGAYYTLKNLIMFHDCKIFADYYPYTTEESMVVLRNRLDEYKGEGWRMFALMKKVLKDNNINTKTHIAEACKNNK
jgi:uncharacterized protein YacL (UPF0231 family)